MLTNVMLMHLFNVVNKYFFIYNFRTTHFSPGSGNEQQCIYIFLKYDSKVCIFFYSASPLAFIYIDEP